MEYRSLGRTGVQVSELCLGCMMFGYRSSDAEALEMIDRSIDAGINFFDTANVYSRGGSELVVGKGLHGNGKRARIVLATKVHGKMDDDDPNAWGNTRRHIIEQCEASLKRLQTDYIDLYQLHRPESATPIDEALRALDDLIRAGKVRYIGSSTYAAWQVIEALWVSKELGLNRFVTEQPPYNLIDRSIERELIPMAQTYGIGVIPWSPLGGGFLSGKYRRGQERPAGSRFDAEKGEPRAERNTTDASFDVAEGLEAMAKDKGCTPSQLALAWCAQQPGITSPIIGPRTMEQLEDNLGALDVDITGDDRQRIDAFAPPGQAAATYYDADWGAGRFRW